MGYATGMNCGPAGDPSLMRWFAGSYYRFSGSTERRVVLCPGGTFRGGKEEVSYRAGRERGCFTFNGTLFCYEEAANCR